MSRSSLQETRPFPEFPRQATLYNAHVWDPEFLAATFLAHLPELRASLGMIHESDPDETSPHLMILGVRGMGKSTFLRRLVTEIRKDPDLSLSWLALSFPEELYTISTLAELWCSVLLSLRECLEQTDPGSSELADLKKLLTRLHELGAKRREEEAFSFLREIRRRRKQGLILCVDNTDLLFRGLASGDSPGERNTSSSAVWRLRRVLGRERGLFWIGSSTRPLEEHPEAAGAFGSFFRSQTLLPPDTKTIKKIMLGFAEKYGMGSETSGERAMKTMERMIHEAPERLEVLRALTGGDPRSVMILCTLFANSKKGEVKSDLTGLLDHMTPFYKTRLEGLSEQPRKIAAHLMEAWHPLSAKEIARATDLPVTTVSGQLSRLEGWGFVEKTNIPNNRRNGFQISERLFNAWYLMRNGFCDMRAPFYRLIEFMRLWFSDEERYNLSQLRSGAQTAGDYPDISKQWREKPSSQALVQEASGAACPDWRLPLFRKKIRQKLQLFLPHIPDAPPASDPASWQSRLAGLDDSLEICPYVQADPAKKKAWILGVKSSPSLALYEKELLAERSPNLTDFQFHGICRLLEDEKQFMESQLGFRDLEVLQQAILDGKFFPDFPDTKTFFNEIQTLFHKQEAAFIYAVGHLFEKKDGKEYLVRGLEKAMTTNSENSHFWILTGNLWQHHAKNPKKAEEAYRKAIAVNPEQASSWNHLGTTLHYELKRYAEAEDAYRQAILLDNKFSWPWNNLGNLFQYHSRNFQKAEEAYEKAIRLDPDNSLAWNNLGNLLHHRLKRYDDAEKAYRNALALDDQNAVFWNNLGNLLRFRTKNSSGALDAYRKAIALDERVPVFWGDLADLLAKDLGQYEEAKRAYEKALELDHDDAWFWTDLGDLLKNRMKAHDEAGEAYRKAIALKPEDPFPKIGLANLLCDHLADYEEAKKLYEEAIERDKEDPWAYARLARAHAKSGDREGAEKNYLLAESLAQSEIWEDSSAVKGILLQAALYLEKNAQAEKILCDMVKLNLEEKEVFFRLKEQARECLGTGLGSKLALLMEESPFSDFLKPFVLALKVAETGNRNLFYGLAPEMSKMAIIVHDEIAG